METNNNDGDDRYDIYVLYIDTIYMYINLLSNCKDISYGINDNSW